MASDDDQQVISAFQERLQDRLFEIENKVDSSVALLSGGAFTVSLAIAPMLDSPLGLRWALVTAWASWASCLLVDLLGHMTSASGHRRMLEQLAVGNVDPDALSESWQRKAIPWLNRIVFLLLVSGFVTFGVFVLANLTFGDLNEKKARQQSSEIAAAESGKEIQGRAETLRQHASLPPDELAAHQAKEDAKGRQVTPAN
jgi:hypothetical protein